MTFTCFVTLVLLVLVATSPSSPLSTTESLLGLLGFVGEKAPGDLVALVASGLDNSGFAFLVRRGVFELGTAGDLALGTVTVFVGGTDNSRAGSVVLLTEGLIGSRATLI